MSNASEILKEFVDNVTMLEPGISFDWDRLPEAKAQLHQALIANLPDKFSNVQISHMTEYRALAARQSNEILDEVEQVINKFFGVEK